MVAYAPAIIVVPLYIAPYQSPPWSYIAGPRQVSEASPFSLFYHREKSQRKAEQKEKKT